ncbi:hypothetical protein E3T33_07260, partial [Cryobacterium sp. TMT1-2-1]|uniref:hypothetical protein n=1 Tax=Cryobacterium sp. TMT1-2-1 TaxID=1259232 RepID=UPI0011042A99
MSTPGGTARYVGEAWLGFVAVATAGLGLALALGLGAAADPALAMAGTVLGLGAAPALLLVVLASWAVRSRLVPARHAVTAALLGVAACTAGTLAAASWAVGFDLADGHRPSTPSAELFADLFLVFLGTNWLLGAAAVFTALDVFVRRTSLSRPRRGIVACLIAVFAAPAIGMSFVAPVTPVLASIAVTVLVLFAGAPRAAPRAADSPAAAAEPEGRAPVGRAPA